MCRSIGVSDHKFRIGLRFMHMKGRIENIRKRRDHKVWPIGGMIVLISKSTFC